MPTSRVIPDELVALINVQPILESLPQAARDQLISSASMMLFDQGEVMILEDEENGFLYLLLKGEAEAEMNGTVAGCLEAGDIAGEISISGISPPIASLTALTKVEAVAFPVESIAEAVRNHPEFGQQLKSAAIRRITGR